MQTLPPVGEKILINIKIIPQEKNIVILPPPVLVLRRKLGRRMKLC
jgi:hypothetical protein